MFQSSKPHDAGARKFPAKKQTEAQDSLQRQKEEVHSQVQLTVTLKSHNSSPSCQGQHA